MTGERRSPGPSWAEYVLLVIFLSLTAICLYILLGPGLDQVYYSLAGLPATPPAAVTAAMPLTPTPRARVCTVGWIAGAVEALDTNADEKPDRLRFGGPRRCLLLLPASTPSADPLLSDLTSDPPRLRCLQVEALDLDASGPWDIPAAILPGPGMPALLTGRLVIQRLEITPQRLELEGQMSGWQSAGEDKRSALAEALAGGAVPIRLHLSWRAQETPLTPQEPTQERTAAWGWMKVPLNIPCP